MKFRAEIGRRSACVLVGVVACGVALLIAAGPASALASKVAGRPLRVLLIGNSYTHANLLPDMLRRISESLRGHAPLEVDSVTHGGFTLRAHLEQGDAAARIRHGRYDLVVLQGHSLSAVIDPFELEQSVRLFDRMIDRTGAQTVLYATWPRRPGTSFYRMRYQVHSFESMANVVHGTYARLAGRLNTRLAPVGRAFARAIYTVPSLELYQTDGSHPSPAGTLLAAYVLYGTLTGQDPRAATYRPAGVSAREAVIVRRIAAETLGPLRQSTRGALAARVASHNAHTP